MGLLCKEGSSLLVFFKIDANNNLSLKSIILNTILDLESLIDSSKKFHFIS